jgi:hypothetical protein
MRKLLVAACALSLIARAASAQNVNQYANQDADHLRNFRDKLIWKGPLLKTAVSALFSEAVNSPKEWGRGADGFAKRAGNFFGQRAVKASVELGISEWTHEDMRFRRLGQGGFWSRLKHATLGTYWVRRDNGPGYTLAAGRIAGAFAAGQISRAWMPDRVATFHAGMQNFGGTVGLDVGLNLAVEFWPRKR